MEKLVKKNCIESLKKPGPPIIIATLPEEAEAVYYAVKIMVSMYLHFVITN